MPDGIAFKLRAGTILSGQSCITDLQGAIDAVQKFVTVQVPEGFSLVIVNDQTPTTEQQSAIWVKQNANDTPEGIYIYATGEWMRIPPLAINSIIWWTGNVSEIPDGYHLCDGTDGAPDLTGNNNFWEGGSPAGVNWNALNTSYTLCPIVWQGLGG